MSITEESDKHDHKSVEEASMRSEIVEASNSAGMVNKLAESLERNQNQLLELTNINKRLIEELAHQSKALIAIADEMKPKSDDKIQKSSGKTSADVKPKTDDDDVDKIQKSSETTLCLLEKYEDLYIAAYSGNWEKATRFFEKHPEAITSELETVVLLVHVATYRKKWDFVVKIVDFLPKQALALKDAYQDYTVLHMAAASEGTYEAAEAIVRKNSQLLEIPDNEGNLPLETAILNRSTEHNKIVEYLYSATKLYYPHLFSCPVGSRLLCTAIEASCYDVASQILKEFPGLVTEKIENRDMYILELMVYRPFEFRSGTKLSWWQRIVYSLISVQTNNIEEENIDGTVRDEENPLESSQGPVRDTEKSSGGSKIAGENDATASQISIASVRSGNNMPFYARVPLVRQLYKMKLNHEQAKNFVTEILKTLDQTKTESEVIEHLNKTGMVHTAIKYGITEFVKECLSAFPDLVSYELGKKTMMQMAIIERNEEIFNTLLGNIREYIIFGEKIDVIICKEDEKGNNILHHTAMLAPPQQLNSVSGAALQMQRELQWFQGVASVVHPFLNHTRNVDGKTAQDVFTEQHNSLRKAGEKWLKDTSGSCMLVATLIATVAFAAAFTVPGGNVSEVKDPKNGFPVFLRNNTFSLYAAADVVALFSSITSVLMFLAIMTSRYAEKDFLKSLPKKLIIGLATLFISMASILVAFGAAFTIILTERYSWAPFPMACFGFISVLLFFLLEFPLFVELMRVTYWPSVLHKNNREPLFSEKEKLRTLQRDRIKQFRKKEKEN